MRNFIFAAAATAAAALAPLAQASLMTVEPFSRGCLRPDGTNDCLPAFAATANYFTGYELSDDVVKRGFLLFDLSGVSGDLVGAELSITLARGWFSPDAEESVAAFEMSAASLATLKSGSGSPAVYSDLGTGVNLGLQPLSQGQIGTTVVQSLAPRWIDALQGAFGGDFGVGLSLTDYSGGTTANEGVFGASGAQPLSLALEFAEPGAAIPAPATLPALLLGLGGLAAVRLRRESVPRS